MASSLTIKATTAYFKRTSMTSWTSRRHSKKSTSKRSFKVGRKWTRSKSYTENQLPLEIVSRTLTMNWPWSSSLMRYRRASRELETWWTMSTFAITQSVRMKRSWIRTRRWCRTFIHSIASCKLDSLSDRLSKFHKVSMISSGRSQSPPRWI